MEFLRSFAVYKRSRGRFDVLSFNIQNKPSAISVKIMRIFKGHFTEFLYLCSDLQQNISVNSTES